ncbi:MAG: type II secretion system minor pseudopilin GspK [Pseudomonadales bacterium]
MVRRAQRGIAVITVLLALAIAVLVCSEVISRVYASMKRSENYLNTQQAWEYALGGEAIAREMLAADFEKDKLSSVKLDHLHEKWAQPLPKLRVVGGSVEVEIYDMQSRFNLNNLISAEGEIQEQQVGVLQKLMSFLGIQSSYADLATRWASYDNDTGDLYDSDKTGYRAADTQFGSVSELRLLKDFRFDEYRRVSPFLSALPVPVRININTAPEPVLIALTDGSEQSVTAVKSFIAQRQQQESGYTSPDVFASMLDMDDDEEMGGEDSDGSEDLDSAEDAEDDEDNDGSDSGKSVLGVNSEYFEVRVIAEYGKNKLWLVSTLFRDEQTGEIHLLTRDTSQKFSLGVLPVLNKEGSKKSSASFIGSDGKSNESENAGFIGN